MYIKQLHFSFLHYNIILKKLPNLLRVLLFTVHSVEKRIELNYSQILIIPIIYHPTAQIQNVLNFQMILSI